jgi:hypothetical protein
MHYLIIFEGQSVKITTQEIKVTSSNFSFFLVWTCKIYIYIYLFIYLKAIVVRKMKDKRMGSLINEWFILHGEWRSRQQRRNVMAFLHTNAACK